MATTAKTKARKASERATRSKAAPAPKAEPQDAIALLEADHREVDGLFDDFEAATDRSEKKALADKICLALKVHTQIEEELFYPPAREKTGDGDLIDEAIVEHIGAKTLIAQIEAMAPGQSLYDAKMKVLSEQVRHHVEEEESELFPEVRKTKLNLDALGAKLAARKAELMVLLAPVPITA
jgi:hemerythrin superfamily protein